MLLGLAARRRGDCSIELSPLMLVGAGLTLFLVVSLSRLRLLLPIAAMAGLLLGLVRGGVAISQLNRYDNYLGNDVCLIGAVDGDPSIAADGTSFTIDAQQIASWDDGKAETISGRVWVSVDDKIELSRYDTVVVSGELADGFGSYSATMRRAVVVSTRRSSNDVMGRLRADFAGQLAKVLEPDQLGLGMGLLAGQKSALSDDIQNAFVAASLTHILVASGYNLTVLVRFARRLFARRSRLIALIASLGLIMAFLLLTGSSASMNRAVLVSVISLLLWYVGRRAHPVVLLLLVAAITAMVDPTQLWGDVGWYLSFSSFAGVIILAPLLNDAIGKLHKLGSRNEESPTPEEADEADLTIVAKSVRRLEAIPGSLEQVLTETLSAQLVTWPIIALFMGNVSLVGLITNIPVLPFLPLAMLLTFVAGLAAIALPLGLAQLIAKPASWMLSVIIAVAEWGAELPGSVMNIQLSIGFVVGYYAVLMLVLLLLKKLTGHNFYGDNVIE